MKKRGRKENLTKIVIKNSVYNFIATFIGKVGSLIFTIMLARMLLPELFGIYNLVLSIAFIALTFTDLGIVGTAVRYISEALGKNNKPKARSYFKYLLKLKGLLTLLVILIIILIARPLAYNVFNKPVIFFPLVFSCLYIFMLSLRELFLYLFYALKDFSKMPIIELSLISSKIVFSLLAILLLSSEFKISGIFIALAASVFLSFTFIILLLGKHRDLIFGKKITIEKPRVLRYLGYMGMVSVSLIFFGSVDTLMLGRFVSASYIGYYRAALGLVTSVAGLLAFSVVLLPIFTQISNKRLERGFQKTFRYIIILTIPATFGLMFIAKYFILAIYGSKYIFATSSLYILSFLIITGPLIALYSVLFQAKEKPKILSQFILIALFINIILNYVLIKYLLNFSQEYAILGAGLATVASRLFFFGALAIKIRSQFKLKTKKSPIIKSIIATIVMVLFLILFTHYVDLNLFLGVIEIALAICVYFAVMWLIKGIGKEDWKMIKLLKK